MDVLDGLGVAWPTLPHKECLANTIGDYERGNDDLLEFYERSGVMLSSRD